LNTCSWVDYNSWFQGDSNDKDNEIKQKLSQISNDDCKWAYVGYFCASAFPRCNENGDGPLPVCRDTCIDLLEKCDVEFQEGVTEERCNALPETECTSAGMVLSPYFITLLAPYAVLFCMWRRSSRY